MTATNPECDYGTGCTRPADYDYDLARYLCPQHRVMARAAAAAPEVFGVAS